MIFLVGYDRSLGKIDVFRTFDDDAANAAFQARLSLELEHAGNADYEALVLESSDEETLRKTHARFFMTAQQLAERSESLVE
jgi:hypothetical protein